MRATERQEAEAECAENTPKGLRLEIEELGEARDRSKGGGGREEEYELVERRESTQYSYSKGRKGGR